MSSTDRLFEPVGWRTDSLGLPRDTKKFEGLQATTSQGVIRPTYFRALTGNSVTASAGSVSPLIEFAYLAETFTDTNGTLLVSTPHIGDYGYAAWTVAYPGSGGNEPTIQSNRLRGAGTTFDGWSAYFGNTPWDWDRYYLEAVFFRRATATGVAAGELSESIYVGGDYGTQAGYHFGWCEADDTWYLNFHDGVSWSTVNSSTTNAFTGTSQSRTIRISVDNAVTSGTCDLKCYVNGTLVISYTAPSQVAGATGMYFNFSGSVDIDSMAGANTLLMLRGNVATATANPMPSFPVSVALTGRSATATANRLYPPNATLELASFVLRGSSGRVTPVRATDTFTGANNTLLGAHTADTGESWTKENSSGTVGDPWIQTNRLQNQNGEYDSLWYLGSSQPANQIVQGTFRYAGTPSADQPQSPHEGLGAYIQIGSGVNADGYFLGYSSIYFGGLWIIWKRQGGGYTQLAYSANTYFYSVGDLRNIRMEVYSSDVDVEIVAYLNDVEIIRTFDNSTPLAPGPMGLWLGNYDGVSTGSTREWTIDTFWSGSSDGNFGRPFGQVATTGSGTLTPSISGGGTNVNLIGQALTLSQGPLVPFFVLTGQTATATQGTLRPIFGIGVYDPNALSVISPQFTVSRHSYGSSGWYRPDEFLYQQLSADGKLVSSGWDYTPNFGFDGSRVGRITFNQRTGLWESFGSASTDEMYADDWVTLYNWPRNGYPSFVPPRPYTFNDWGPTYSNVDPQGNVHTGTIRYRNSYTTVNGLTTALNRTQIVMFGWQSTDITVGGGRYLGPELTENVQAFYPYHPDKVLAFYTARQFSGNKCNSFQGILYPAVDYGAGTMQLQGLAATTSQGALLRATNEPGGVYVVPLVVDPQLNSLYRARTSFGIASDTQRPNLGVVNPTQPSTFLMFRGCTTTSMEWGPPVSLGLPSGLIRVQSSGTATFVPTGDPDVVFVVYPAAGITSTAATVYTQYACVATVNTRTQTVLAHTALALTIGAGSISKLLGDVVRQDGGQCYAQLHFGNCALHMAWTYSVGGGYSAPTLTEKAYPADTTLDVFMPSMSTFETRADRGYQMLPVRGGSLISSAKLYLTRVYYNDMTSTSAAWTLATSTYSGSADNTLSGESFMEARDGPTFIGSGGGYRSLIFQADAYNPAFLGPTYESYWTWNNFWNSQSVFFSVQATGRVGTVGVSITPNVQLTGLRAEAQINPLDLVAGGPHRDKLLRGRRATASRGVLAPPSFNFFFDTYNNSSTELLEVHLSDSGHSYTTYQTGKLNSAGSILIPVTAGVGGNAIANVQPPTPNYRVSAHLFSGGITQPANTPSVGIVARADNVYLTNGYLFGHNRAYDYAFLLKLGQTGGPVIALGPAPGSALYEIEVNGQYPTRVTCRIDGVVWYEYDDYGTYFEGPYTGVGYIGVRFVGLGAGASNTGAIGDINAAYYDPGLVVLTGQRATTGFYTNNFGLPGGAGLIGNAATATAGVLEGGFGLSGLSVTATGGHLYPEINLTGLAATATGGTLYTYAAALTGLSITATRGFFAGFPAIRQLIGQRATLTPGLLALLNRELLGLRATIIRGDVIFTVDAYPTLLGYMLATARGLLVPQDTKASTGNVATATIGTLGAVTSAGATLTGLTATATRGVLGYTNVTAVVPTGLRVNTAQGSLAPSAANDTTLAGRTATASVGTILSTVTVAAVGAQAVSSQGVGIPLLVLTPQGRLAVTAAGTMQMLTNIALTGRSCTLSRGTMTDAHGCTLYPAGVAATGRVGSARFNPLAPGIELFVQADPDELRAADEPDELVAGP